MQEAETILLSARVQGVTPKFWTGFAGCKRQKLELL